MQITDTTTQRVEVFCGDLPPFLWTSAGNEVLLRFITDETIGKDGFRLAYKKALLPEKRFPDKGKHVSTVGVSVRGGKGDLSLPFPEEGG